MDLLFDSQQNVLRVEFFKKYSLANDWEVFDPWVENVVLLYLSRSGYTEDALRARKGWGETNLHLIYRKYLKLSYFLAVFSSDSWCFSRHQLYKLLEDIQ